MLYQAPADPIAGMQAKLQKAGVPFNAAMSAPKRLLRAAAESQEAFDRLVRQLTTKAPPQREG